MRVRFWGVRGSTPTPQKENMGYGGNTSCIEIRTDSNQLLIFDGGTGIRNLGNELEQELGDQPIHAHIFFSHFHLDIVPMWLPVSSFASCMDEGTALRYNLAQPPSVGLAAPVERLLQQLRAGAMV